MNFFDNNQFEVKPSAKSKRKITSPCPNAYLNPGLDLLANEDPMCNTAMEIVPIKKRKRSKSCDIAAFENTGLDIGISKAAVNKFLATELENVRKTMKSCEMRNDEPTLQKDIHVMPEEIGEPICTNITDTSVNYPNITDMSVVEEVSVPATTDLSGFQQDISDIEMDSGISVLEQKSINTLSTDEPIDNNMKPLSNSSANTMQIQKNITNQVLINNTSNISLSFIDRLALDSPSLSNQSLYLDDDLNESNIMEIKTITIITKKKRVIDKKKNTNPFLDPNINDEFAEPVQNPFLMENTSNQEMEYNEAVAETQMQTVLPQGNNLLPRRLFITDTNSTISTVNESSYTDHHEYENIDNYRSESPIYENIGGDIQEPIINKQSKILGQDVSRFSAIDIMNLNKNSEANSSNESNDSKKDLKRILKAGNKLSKKVFKTLKNTFKHDKIDHNVTLNPYEVPRKPPKQKIMVKESGIENPALNLDNSDEIEIEELDDEEHQYETVKTLRNTQLNMNVTPLKERINDNFDNSHSKPHTPGKKVRFDSTLNQEKVITGNSFDYDIQSPGFDAKIDKYHDELENCINERKFIQQNM